MSTEAESIWGQIEEVVAGLQDNDPDLDREHALLRALTLRPELFHCYWALNRSEQRHQ